MNTPVPSAEPLDRRAGRILQLAALLGLLGVAAGAFGAHALRELLSPPAQELWGTAVLYQLVHAVALLGVAAVASQRGAGKALTLAATLFGVGVLLFSGSLYVLALSGIRMLGAITPVGGVALLAGWWVLLLAGSPRRWSAD